MRWPWSKSPPVTPAVTPSTPLDERVDVLEDRYNRLVRRFDRMQGEFNALNRAQVDDDELEEESAYE